MQRDKSPFAIFRNPQDTQLSSIHLTSLCLENQVESAVETVSNRGYPLQACQTARQTDLPRHRHSSRLLRVSSTVSVGSGDGQQGAKHRISGILSHHLKIGRRWTLTPSKTQPRGLINRGLVLIRRLCLLAVRCS